MKGRVSIIIPGRCEPYFRETIDSVLESAKGDIEVIAIVDGPGQEPPVISHDARVKVIELNESVGQRAAYNLGVRESTGEYIMKIDAHALVSPGFDEALKAHCPPKTTVLPEMRRLDVRNWVDKPKGRTHYMYPGMDLYCHYWKDYRKRDAAKAEYPEVMTGQGSCWFTTREWNDHIGLLDEGVGSWGNVGIEVSLRTWLCGGTQIVNKKAWQAHWFRVSDGGFPYPMSGRQVHKAHQYTWNNYYFKDDAFKNQIRPFRWYIRKFAPVPSWEVYLQDEYKANRVIVYYTDNQLETSLAEAVRKNLATAAGPIPIISVSQKPLNFGRNICVGEKPKTAQSMYEQILIGLEAAPDNSVVYLCEHDVFYHPSHFAKVPKDNGAFYFNRNRYYWWVGDDSFYRASGSKALSQAVVTKEYALAHVKQRLDNWVPFFKVRRYSWNSSRPNIDVRHGNNLTLDGPNKSKILETGIGAVQNLGGWGGTSHFQSTVKYKGAMRYDIIQYLIDQHGYKSYLEIGCDKNETFKRINCELKHGIDPKSGGTHRMISDEFFRRFYDTYDLIFIDGLHEAEQVKKDITNALKHLNPGGVIVMHDCKPRNEAEQTVPRLPLQKIWIGDGWKAFVEFRQRDDLDMYVVDTNNGIGIIRHGIQEPLKIEAPLEYKHLKRNMDKWLNLKTVEWFKNAEVRRSIQIS